MPKLKNPKLIARQKVKESLEAVGAIPKHRSYAEFDSILKPAIVSAQNKRGVGRPRRNVKAGVQNRGKV